MERLERLSNLKMEIDPGYEGFLPDDFRKNPVKYFEEKGINIKSGEVQLDEGGSVKEDPTAVKELPEWTDTEGQKLNTVAKKVNIEKSQVGVTGDPFYEYKIMEIAKEFNLPAAMPIAKIEQDKTHLIVMKKIDGLPWTEKSVEVLNNAGFTEEDKEGIIGQAEKMMQDLETRFSEIGLNRKWKLKDMIFDIDLKNKTLRSLTPTDWERTKIDQDKLEEARVKRSGI